MLLDVSVSRLKNGIRVVTAALPHVQSVSMGVWVGVGGRHETPALEGMSHFIEHLLFKGTRTRSARDISQAIEGSGGYCNAFTHEEMTCYYAKVAFDHAWKVLDILVDMYRRPRFAAEDIAKERGVIIEEIMMYRDQPEHVVQEMLNTILWKNHDLGRPLIGSPDSLRRIRRADIAAFKNGKYVPANTIVSFAGQVRHEQAVAHVERLMADLAPARPPVCRPVTPAVGQERLALKSKAIEQTQLALGFRTFGRQDRRRHTLKVLSVILGENMSSRLFQVVRERHGLAYAVHSGAQLFADTGGLFVSAGLDRARRGQAITLILREIARLTEERVGPRELNRAKEYIVGHIRLALESPSGQMMWVGENLLHHGRHIPAEEVIAAVQAVRAEDVRTLAGAVFRRRAASVALLSPGLERADETRIRSALACL